MERIYLSIVSGQFAQWSKEAKNKHFVRVTRVDDEGNTVIGKGYRRYFDDAEGRLVKIWETDTDFGLQVNIALETDMGMFVISMNEKTQSGQVTDYLKSFLLSTKTMKSGNYYKLVPYSITTNRDGSERTRALNGITVYEEIDGDFVKIEDKFTVEYVKDGVVEEEGDIPALVFVPGKRKNDKMKVDHEAQTDALLGLLDDLIEETKDYELPKSGNFKSKSAISAFGGDDDDDTPTGAEALGIEPEEYEEEEETPVKETKRVPRTPARIASKKVKVEEPEPQPEEEVEEEAEETQQKSTVERRPRRTPAKETKTVKKNNSGLPF